MSKIKYQLVPTEAVRPPDRTVMDRFLKICLLCAIFLILIFCSWSISTSTDYPDEPATTMKHAVIAAATTSGKNSTETLGPNILDRYYVFTSKCHMPALDPFAKDAMKIFNKSKYYSCDASKALITMSHDDKSGRYTLTVNKPHLKCCYKRVLRSGSGASSDKAYKLMPCQYFTYSVLIPLDVDAVITECRRLKSSKIIQQDAFTFVQPAQHVHNRTATGSKHRRPSILLWGIDSLSRMNFRRNMPLMHKFFKEQDWYELQGYNKMGDNTYPNLMALLTGFNASRSYSVCKPEKVGALDDCPMMWKKYQSHGYVTAYAEEWVNFTTFNFNKKGFRWPPTDYYPRPLMLAIEEHLHKVTDSGIPYCLGRRHYAEYVYDFAEQFSKIHKNDSTFGLFWSNSFSHNNFHLPSSMDARMVTYMRSLQKIGVLEKSIILFFSDHGMRFGALRKLDSGFLEERMPIMFIWLPRWFRQTYPKFAHSLKHNRNRLTSPYDIYSTLQHILHLHKPRHEQPPPEGCSSCHSVFYEVSESRDCLDAGIEPHWCTCHVLKHNNPNEAHIKTIAEQLIQATNAYLVSKKLDKLCRPLNLSSIETVQRKISIERKKYESYLVKYTAEPQACLFEASTDWNNVTQSISVNVPDISRLNSYTKIAHCIDDSIAKKFCVCYDYEENTTTKPL